MNSIAVFLILAFLTGFQAAVLGDEPTKSTLWQVQEQTAEILNMGLDKLKNLSSEGFHRALDLANQVPKHLSKQSSNIQRLNQNLQQHAKNAKQKLQEGVSQIQEHAFPQLKKLINVIVQQTQAIIPGIETMVDGVKNKMQPITENLKEAARQFIQVGQTSISRFTEQRSSITQPPPAKKPAI